MNHPELTQSTATSANKSRNEVSATASHTQSTKKVVETDNITTTAAAEKT